MSDSTERLRCRCCGIASPDVGFTEPGDLLCDDCETVLCAHLGALAWRGFMASRARVIAAREAERERARSAFVAHVAWLHREGAL